MKYKNANAGSGPAPAVRKGVISPLEIARLEQQQKEQEDAQRRMLRAQLWSGLYMSVLTGMAAEAGVTPQDVIDRAVTLADEALLAGEIRMRELAAVVETK